MLKKGNGRLHTVANDPQLAAMVADAKGLKVAGLLNDARSFIDRFCVFPDKHALAAVTLWAAHAHMIQHFHTSPRLALLSPEPGSGKTRVLEVLDLLVPNPQLSLNASPATIFRTLSKTQITLLFDEVDSIWNKRAKDDNHEDLRALLNAGYKLGATIPRCVGPTHEVKNFPVFAAVALAGIGELPDTIMSRAIIIRMRRRAPRESVEPFRTREHEAPGHALRDRLAEWSATVGAVVGASWPALPTGIVDRPAEIWEPLIAVADAVGGEWPATARAACIALCHSALDRRVSLGVRLLSDLRLLFGDSVALHTETILSRLCNGEPFGLASDAPWGDLYGKPISVRKLASILGEYGVPNLKVKVDGRSLQGYRREHLWDAWQRYLSPYPPQAEPVEPPEPRAVVDSPQVPQVPQVPHLGGTERVEQLDLESRIHTMARHWGYSDDELATVLADAVNDPAATRRFVEQDENRRRLS
jgi:hypothetical protein